MRRRIVALTALVVMLPGCYSWRPVATPSPREYLQSGPDQARVFRMHGGPPIVMRDWTVVGDSIRGTALSGSGGRTTRTLAFDDIVRVDQRRFDGLKTLGAVAVTWGVVSTIVVLVAFSQADGSWWGASY